MTASNAQIPMQKHINIKEKTGNMDFPKFNFTATDTNHN
jgi:hypothetical protein